LRFGVKNVLKFKLNAFYVYRILLKCQEKEMKWFSQVDNKLLSVSSDFSKKQRKNLKTHADVFKLQSISSLAIRSQTHLITVSREPVE